MVRRSQAELVDVERELARGLDGIGVEERAGGVGDFGELANGLEDAGFVVGEHDRDEAGVGLEGGFESGGLDAAGGGGLEKGDFDAASLQSFGGVEDGVVLDLCGDEVCAGGQGSEQSEVVAFGAAGGEDNFGGSGAEKVGDGIAGVLDGGAGVLAGAVDRAGVGEVGGEEGAHGFDDLREQRCGGVGVEVDGGHGFILDLSGQRSAVSGQRSAVRGQRAAVRGQGSGVRLRGGSRVRQAAVLVGWAGLCKERTMTAGLRLAAAVVMGCCAMGAQGQMGSDKPPVAVGQAMDPAKALDEMLTMFEGQLMGVARAMPAEKYGFAPSAAVFAAGSPAKFDTVRTFAQQVAHLTQANYYFYMTGERDEAGSGYEGDRKFEDKRRAGAGTAGLVRVCAQGSGDDYRGERV